MLWVTRRVGKIVWIRGNIAVTVLRVQGNQVRLGIEVPGDALIRREEIADVYRPEQAAGGGEA